MANLETTIDKIFSEAKLQAATTLEEIEEYTNFHEVQPQEKATSLFDYQSTAQDYKYYREFEHQILSWFTDKEDSAIPNFNEIEGWEEYLDKIDFYEKNYKLSWASKKYGLGAMTIFEDEGLKTLNLLEMKVVHREFYNEKLKGVIVSNFEEFHSSSTDKTYLCWFFYLDENKSIWRSAFFANAKGETISEGIENDLRKALDMKDELFQPQKIAEDCDELYPVTIRKNNYLERPLTFPVHEQLKKIAAWEKLQMILPFMEKGGIGVGNIANSQEEKYRDLLKTFMYDGIAEVDINGREAALPIESVLRDLKPSSFLQTLSSTITQKKDEVRQVLGIKSNNNIKSAQQNRLETNTNIEQAQPKIRQSVILYERFLNDLYKNVLKYNELKTSDLVTNLPAYDSTIKIKSNIKIDQPLINEGGNPNA